jgi:hypothetical protein
VIAKGAHRRTKAGASKFDGGKARRKRDGEENVYANVAPRQHPVYSARPKVTPDDNVLLASPLTLESRWPGC